MDVSAWWVLFVVHPPFAGERDRRDNHDPRRRFPARFWTRRTRGLPTFVVTLHACASRARSTHSARH